MVWKHTIGQKKTKRYLKYLLDTFQVPHAQVFKSDSGYGNLAIGIEFALNLLNVKGPTEDRKTLGERCQQPNLHFIYPVVKRGSENTVFSIDYIKDWYEFLNISPYGSYIDWFDHINVGNKQGAISVSEITKLHHSLSLKGFGGGNKVCLLWGLEKMNAPAANAFLKLLEEPPKKTYFILLCESTENVLLTVLSRCQELSIGPIEEYALLEHIPKSHPNKTKILKQAQGNFITLKNLLSDGQDEQFEALLVKGLRFAFKAKTNKVVIMDLMNWSNELALMGRESQKAFLRFGVQFFRDAFLRNYDLSELVHFTSDTGFDIDKLAPFIHQSNIQKLIDLFENHHYYVQRNANSKMMFTEIALKLTTLITTPKD